MNAPTSGSLYVYYRCEAAHEAEVRAAAAALAADCAPGPWQVLRRPELRDGHLHTWMEIYEAVPDLEALKQRLDQALAADHPLAALLCSPRHAEVFLPQAHGSPACA